MNVPHTFMVRTGTALPLCTYYLLVYCTIRTVFFNRDFPATSYQVIVFVLFLLKTNLLSTV